MSNSMVISLVVRVAVIVVLRFLMGVMAITLVGNQSMQKVLGIFIGAAQTAIFIWLVVDVVRLIIA